MAIAVGCHVFCTVLFVNESLSLCLSVRASLSVPCLSRRKCVLCCPVGHLRPRRENIPPTIPQLLCVSPCSGWATFGVALAFIGIVTAVVGEIASSFGCMVNLKDSVTAITFVALGTSLPDTFASKSAALNEKHADASLGNITGSNRLVIVCVCVSVCRGGMRG